MSDHRHTAAPDPSEPYQDLPVWGEPAGGPVYPPGQPTYGAHSDPVTYGRPGRAQPPAAEPYQEPPQPQPPRSRRKSGDPDFDENRWGAGDRWDDDDEPRRFRIGRRKKSEEPEPAVPAMAATPPPPPQRPPGEPAGERSEGRGKGLGALGWIAIVMTTILVAGTLTLYTVYRKSLSGITTRDITNALGNDRPKNETGALNVLLVGSDTRQGNNARYGQQAARTDLSERTDTIMLLHVSPNRDKARLISFPRDSVVTMPECHNPKTKARIAPRLGMINSAFNDGGIVCTIKTIETLTDIRIDHYIKVDFTGFKNIVNALQGIEICLPHAVNDRESKLNLPAGRQVVMGEAALGYVRIRKGLGDGSDIQRMKRQQLFISQIVKKATSGALLTDPNKILSLVEAGAKSVEMDDQLNVETLVEIAGSAKKLTASGFKADTVPWAPDPANPQSRVIWKQPAAANLFAAIKSDTEVKPEASAAASPAPTATTTGAADAKPAKPKPTEPAQVRVQVINGTKTDGKAREVAEALTAQGFKVIQVGGGLKADGTEQAATMVNYKGSGWEGSKLVAGALLNEVKPATSKIATANVTPFVATTPAPNPAKKAVGPVIQLVIGADWEGVRVSLDSADSDTTVTAETDICKT